MLEALHFIRPWWLLAIPLALLVGWYWSRRRGGGSHWEASIEPDLLRVLLEPSGRPSGRTLPALVTASLCAGALGLAGPAWERLPQPVEQRGDAMVILLDLSLSMFATDVAPSRIVRARQKIADVLRRRDEGFTALVAYAGDAHAVVPLTDDTRTIENLLPALSPDMMPVLGSNLAAALDLAHSLFANAQMSQGRMLLITDGIDRLSDATERRDPNFPLSVLGVGTEKGAAIPLDFVNQPGEVLRTQQGEAIVPRLDEQRLRNAAEIGYGRYRSLGLDDVDIDYLLATPMPGEDDTMQVDREFDTWADQGFWVCLLLLPLMLAAFRRGVLAGAPLVLVPAAVALASVPGSAQAGLWDDLWQRRDQQAHQALRQGEPEAAATLFDDPDWRAAALYRSEEYAAAAAAYAGRDDASGDPSGDPSRLYNLGNALARLGEYRSAIAAYDRVLAEHPDHEDAGFNKALVEKLLEEQQSQEQEQSQSQDDQRQSDPQDSAQNESQGGEDQNQPDQQPGSSEPAEQQADAEQQPQSGEQAESAEEESPTSRDERQDAMEQWLRRVPDDPGGLLKRKFQYETNQRLRRGDYRSRESQKIW